MKTQFDIWHWIFPERGAHPCIIISHPDIAARAELVNVLYCTSQRQSRPPKQTEVLLDTADGFDWETFCNCSVLWLVPSTELYARIGQITPVRRNQIRDKVRDLFRLAARD